MKKNIGLFMVLNTSPLRAITYRLFHLEKIHTGRRIREVCVQLKSYIPRKNKNTEELDTGTIDTDFKKIYNHDFLCKAETKHFSSLKYETNLKQLKVSNSIWIIF